MRTPLALLLVALPPAPCDASEAWHAARAAVVHISQAAGVGAGFLFHSSRHVATAYHVVQAGREPRVRLQSGQELAARVVAVSTEDDLAILELESEVEGVAPLVLATSAAPAVGAPVTVIGHPYSPQADVDPRLAGLLDWSVSTGVVSAVSARYVQTDAAINQGNSGGPLLDAEGRVVGVVVMQIADADGLGFAVAAPLLAELEARIDPGLDFRGEWAPGLGLSWRTDVGGGTEQTGFFIGMRTVAWDRLALELRLGTLGSGLLDDGTYPRTQAGRLTTALAAGWRFLAVLPGNVPLYVVPSLGVSVDRDAEVRLELLMEQADRSCEPGPGSSCQVSTRVQGTSTRDDVSLRPLVGLGLELGPLLVGYEVRPVDLADPLAVVHQVVLGFWL